MKLLFFPHFCYFCRGLRHSIKRSRPHFDPSLSSPHASQRPNATSLRLRKGWIQLLVEDLAGYPFSFPVLGKMGGTGYPNSWMVHHGKSQSKMDDN